MVEVDKNIILKNKPIEEIISNSSKPMSLLEIKDRYKLSFPFEVMRVIGGMREDCPVKIGETYIIRNITMVKLDDGERLVSQPIEKVKDTTWFLCANKKAYVLC